MSQCNWLPPEYYHHWHTARWGCWHLWLVVPSQCAQCSDWLPLMAYPKAVQLSWPPEPQWAVGRPSLALGHETKYHKSRWVFCIFIPLWNFRQLPLVYATQSISVGFNPASSSASRRTVRITLRWCLAVSLGRKPKRTWVHNQWLLN